jgi:ribosomal protein L29
MDIKTLRAKTKEAQEKELQQAQAHLKELQFGLSSHQLKNVRDVRKTKQLIARIETILKEQAVTQAS